jgi:hypothetical protein
MFPHTKHDKLGYHPIHYTHDTDYQIQSRNTIELRQSSKFSNLSFTITICDMIWWFFSICRIFLTARYTGSLFISLGA